MADLTGILNGPWEGKESPHVDPPHIQLRQAIRDAGLEPPDEINLDGKIHRFRSGTKGSPGHDKAGWYVGFGDGIPAGRFGCWRSGVEVLWRADVGRPLSASEEMAHALRLSEAKAQRDEARKKSAEVVAETVETIWAEAQAAKPEHPYLARKGILPHGARITGDGRLVLPLFSQDGSLSSLQYVDHDGGKLYHQGGVTGAKFWMVGSLDDPGPLYIAEGFATAATIHQVTGRPCAVAYSASNLVPVTGILRTRYGSSQDIVIVADNDASGVGQRYGEQASAKHGARMIVPPIPGDANDYVQAGHDLSSLLLPVSDDWLVPADTFSSQPSPITWLVKRWVQADALVMVHGPSGGGKTFVVLDWCLRMAASVPLWAGQKVRQGNVVYLAGEGHHGLRGRIAAWRHHHKVDHLNMWLSRDGCDLNTAGGYLKVVDQVRLLPSRPAVIVVDTLHRFLSGDENSAQDAKTMLDACNALMREFGCTVILVHHTGVSEEAQHRARGSSAWRGALDIEISIIPAKDNAPIQIVQRKSKDAEMAEPVFASLEQVIIPGWFDEDNNPVSSAVLIESLPPAASKKTSKIDSHRKTFENAWWASGAEERNGQPYLSRSAMMDYCVTKLGLSEASARQYTKPSVPGKPISDLLTAQIVEAFEHGWIVIDDAHASAMMIRKGEG